MSSNDTNVRINKVINRLKGEVKYLFEESSLKGSHGEVRKMGERMIELLKADEPNVELKKLAHKYEQRVTSNRGIPINFIMGASYQHWIEKSKSLNIVVGAIDNLYKIRQNLTLLPEEKKKEVTQKVDDLATMLASTKYGQTLPSLWHAFAMKVNALVQTVLSWVGIKYEYDEAYKGRIDHMFWQRNMPNLADNSVDSQPYPYIDSPVSPY